VRIVVRGLVQGVGFRVAARREAERLGLRGSVRNEADGTVSVVALGSAEAIERMAAWCANGPAGARVDEFVIDALPAGQAIGEGFTVER